MYQALYRKYRPKIFADVAGQGHITEVLRRQVNEGRVSHAYLFTGSRGTGKTTCAKILAKAVNCLEPADGQPCGRCSMCTGIENGSETDVVEIDAASNNSVENIRDLRSAVNYTPSSAKYRVYIIDEVHMLSVGAFNALLKTLEEPPSYVIFILATTEIQKLPATILSRCQRFDFRRLGADVIADRVKYVCGCEKLNITDDAAMLIGRLADGAMRDALSLLDVCAAAGSDIDENSVISAAGMAGKDKIFELADCFAEKRTGDALKVISALYGSSHDMQRLCSELMSHFRDMMICAAAKDHNGLVTGTSDELSRLERQAGSIGLDGIMHIMTVLKSTMESFRASGSSPLVQMEMAAVEICADTPASAPVYGKQEVAPAQTASAAPTRVISAEKATAAAAADKKPSAAKAAAQADEGRPPWEDAGDSSLPDDGDAPPPDGEDAYAPPEDVSPAPAADSKSSSPADGNGETEALPDCVVLCDKWPEIMDALAGRNRAMYAVLIGSRAFIKGELLLIDAKNSLFKDMVNSGSRHRNDIRAAAKEVLGKEYRLGPYSPAPAESKGADALDILGAALDSSGFNVK